MVIFIGDHSCFDGTIGHIREINSKACMMQSKATNTNNREDAVAITLEAVRISKDVWIFMVL